MEFLFAAHSGLRYLVLLAAAAALAYLVYGWLARRPYDRAARILTAVFVGVLDLQVLLGILLLLVRPFYPALSGHVVMMLLAAAAAHGFSVAARRREVPGARYRLAATGVALALLLVVGGIFAIGRGLFTSTVT